MKTKRLSGRALQERRARWFAQHPLCETCKEKGITRVAEQLDHRTPLHKGGLDTPENWASICIPCHKEKSIKERGYTYKPTIGADGYPVEDA